MNRELIKQITKRGLDIVLAGTALVVLFPLLLGLAGLIRYKLGRPVFFRQRRPGLSGKPFELMKFRTMTSVCNQRGELLPDELRLTKFGQWLRSTSLDELPELINVFKGDWSATVVDGVPATLHRRTKPAASCPARNYRLGSNQWPQPAFLGSQI